MTKNAVAVRPTPAPAVSSESKTLTMGPVSMRRGPPSEAAPKRRSYSWQPYQPLAPSLVTGRANAAPMPSECRANAVPGQIDARGTAPHHAPPPCTPPPEAAPRASAGSSGRHAHHPPAETDLAIQPRPAHVAGVPAAGVPDGDAASVVANPDEPVPLVEPACAIHQQRAPVRPSRDQFMRRGGDGLDRPSTSAYTHPWASTSANSASRSPPAVSLTSMALRRASARSIRWNGTWS